MSVTELRVVPGQVDCGIGLQELCEAVLELCEVAFFDGRRQIVRSTLYAHVPFHTRCGFHRCS